MTKTTTEIIKEVDRLLEICNKELRAGWKKDDENKGV